MTHNALTVPAVAADWYREYMSACAEFAANAAKGIGRTPANKPAPIPIGDYRSFAETVLELYGHRLSLAAVTRWRQIAGFGGDEPNELLKLILGGWG